MIIGAGPAGLTAAYELLHRTDIRPVLFEASEQLGGLAKTVHFKGNRLDIGGHRFFSKSDRVMKWWDHILPLQGPGRESADLEIAYQGKRRKIHLSGHGPDPASEDRVMLVRRRKSRILFRRKLFPYPLTIGWRTLADLGWGRAFKIAASYLATRFRPKLPEESLEDFFINRFGNELYRIFFKDYTEKVWGISTREIKPEWGAQRIKGLSFPKTLSNALKRPREDNGFEALNSKKTETSLIENFLYPKYGPGQLWEEVARIVLEKGGEIHRPWKAVAVKPEGGRIAEVTVQDAATGRVERHRGDYFFSSMPVRDLVACFGDEAPREVREIAAELPYRDLIVVGLLLKKLTIPDREGRAVKDNWIYIQEGDVKVCRLQIFNNWSPYLVRDPETFWLGLEYFCQEGDALWNLPDGELVRFASEELRKIGFARPEDILDGTVVRAPKAYPAYHGAYEKFSVLREFADRFENLYLIGRNGMHRYNNQDHSMLTAMTAVDHILKGRRSKAALWSLCTESDYIEEK
jgi:protoporphyrinogen oxidase